MIKASPQSKLVRIGSICELINGRAFKPTDWTEDGLPIVRIQNLNNPIAKFNRFSGEVRSRFLIDSGVLLFAWSGTPGTSFGAHIWEGGPAVLNQHIFNVVFDDTRVDRDYLRFAMNHKVADLITQAHGGVGLQHVTKGMVENTEILLPSLTEQRRIVDLLVRAEGIVRLQREAQLKAAEFIPSLFLDMFGDPITNPKGWPTAMLAAQASFVSGGTPSKAREDFWIGRIPWVSPKDMKNPTIVDAIDHVNEKVLQETNIKLVPSGAILIVVRGMILVHTVPVAATVSPVTINQDIKALIPNSKLNSTYLLWMLRVLHPKLLGMVSTAAHGTKKLDTERLQSLDLPITPAPLQACFASRAASLVSIQSQQIAATQRAQKLFNALVAKVFSEVGRQQSTVAIESAAVA
jgi:type I restriction enzyme S subunit